MNVAREQLKSVVERIEYTPGNLMREISDKDDRYEYGFERLSKLHDFANSKTRNLPYFPMKALAIKRAVNANQEIVGKTGRSLWHQIKTYSKYGGVKALRNRCADYKYWEVPNVKHVNIGFVYIAKASNFPDVIKIGFSKNPEQRIKKLGYSTKIKIELVHCVVGTKLDEALAHESLSKYSLANEWFDLSGRIQAAIPLVYTFTPDRMWRKLRNNSDSLHEVA